MKPESKIRNELALTSVAMLMLMSCQLAIGQDYPSKPIKMIANNSPGGVLDTLSRLAAGSLSQRAGVPVAVENKPGAGGIIGAEAVVRSAPDGYTLLFSALDGLGVYPLAVKMPFNTATDLLPIAKMTEAFGLYVTSVKSPAKNIKEFIALAKAQPGKLSIASNGVGSTNHMNFELLKARAGIDIVHVPYKGSAAAGIPDTISGRIDAMVTGIAPIRSHVLNGVLRVLVVTSPSRSTVFPDVPTMIESGFPSYVSGSLFGVFAPAGTPQEIVRKLARELSEIASSDEFGALTAKIGAVKSVSVMEEFGRQIAEETRLWHTLAKEQNIRLSE